MNSTRTAYPLTGLLSSFGVSETVRSRYSKRGTTSKRQDTEPFPAQSRSVFPTVAPAMRGRTATETRYGKLNNRADEAAQSIVDAITANH